MKNRYVVCNGVAYIYDCNNECFMVDESELPKISSIKWRCRKGDYPYVIGSTRKGQKIYLHRLIMGATDFMQKVDHINHNTRDNRKENLRLCTNRENSINRINRKNEGVSYRVDKNRWRAYINVNYRQINLGSYKTEKEARIARANAEKIFFSPKEVV